MARWKILDGSGQRGCEPHHHRNNHNHNHGHNHNNNDNDNDDDDNNNISNNIWIQCSGGI